MLGQFCSKERTHLIGKGQTVLEAVELFFRTRKKSLVVVDEEDVPRGILWAHTVMEYLAAGKDGGGLIDSLLDPKLLILREEEGFSQLASLPERLPVAIVDKERRLLGVVGEEEYCRGLLGERESWQNLRDAQLDLNAIMESAEDLMCISDGVGNKLRVSPSAIRLKGAMPQDLVGKNVRELERMGVYFPSATRLAIERKEQVMVTQVTKTDRKLMVIANPIFNEDGEIVRVVSISKDITDQHQLEQELELTRELMERYERELSELRQVNLDVYEVVAVSKAMQELFQLVARVAKVDSTVLILGESGVGKEIIAKMLHGEGKRREGPFIKINCGAIPETLLESELFGYEKGAFTGASRKGKPGLVELARGGTLFLDEIAELPLNLQVKILRLLQEREFVRVGGIRPQVVDIRIVAATNRDIKKMVEKGSFRRDLYYRLNVVPLGVPPLRERREDIPALVHHFLQRFSEKYARTRHLTPEAMELLLNYSWPGNVRELENIIERIVVTTLESQVTAAHLPTELQLGKGKNSRVVVNGIIPLKVATQSVEEQLVLRAMEKYKNTYKAAEALGVNQSTVVRKMQKYSRGGEA